MRVPDTAGDVAASGSATVGTAEVQAPPGHDQQPGGLQASDYDGRAIFEQRAISGWGAEPGLQDDGDTRVRRAKVARLSQLIEDPDASCTGYMDAGPHAHASPSTTYMAGAAAGDDGGLCGSGSGDGEEGGHGGSRVGASSRLPPRPAKRSSKSASEDARHGGRFSGRLPNKADEVTLVQECELLGPLVSERRNESEL